MLSKEMVILILIMAALWFGGAAIYVIGALKIHPNWFENWIKHLPHDMPPWKYFWVAWFLWLACYVLLFFTFFYEVGTIHFMGKVFLFSIVCLLLGLPFEVWTKKNPDAPLVARTIYLVLDTAFSVGFAILLVPGLVALAVCIFILLVLLVLLAGPTIVELSGAVVGFFTGRFLH